MKTSPLVVAFTSFLFFASCETPVIKSQGGRCDDKNISSVSTLQGRLLPKGLCGYSQINCENYIFLGVLPGVGKEALRPAEDRVTQSSFGRLWGKRCVTVSSQKKKKIVLFRSRGECYDHLDYVAHLCKLKGERWRNHIMRTGRLLWPEENLYIAISPRRVDLHFTKALVWLTIFEFSNTRMNPVSSKAPFNSLDSLFHFASDWETIAIQGKTANDFLLPIPIDQNGGYGERLYKKLALRIIKNTDHDFFSILKGAFSVPRNRLFRNQSAIGFAFFDYSFSVSESTVANFVNTLFDKRDFEVAIKEAHGVSLDGFGKKLSAWIRSTY